MDNTPLTTEDIQKQIDKTATDAQYGVAPVPYHTHNGTDSPVVTTLTSIAASGKAALSGDAILAAGSNISLSQSGQTITVTNSYTSTAKAVDLQTFATPGSASWTKPSGTTANSMVYIQMWGGGGGGAGTNGNALTVGAGGGGAEYAEISILASALNSTVALTVGAGGAGGVGNASGHDGTSSTFPTSLPLCTARPGGGATYTTPSGTGGGYFGGNPATNGDAQDANSGSAGQPTFTGSNTAFKGGAGGAGNAHPATGGVSQFGGNGGDTTSGNGNGGAGNQPAGGGAGACRATGAGTNQTGGKGGDGLVRIWTIF